MHSQLTTPWESVVGSLSDHPPFGLARPGPELNLLLFLLYQKISSGTLHTSWEALAQLCIVLIVHEKCEPRPGLTNIQSGSDNTGAEANINHGFSTTEVLSDIIKLVSMTQLRCNGLLKAHHIPGEKNIDADNLSRGKTSSFSHKWKICWNLSTIFDTTPFPRYMNSSAYWNVDIHPGANVFFFFSFFFLASFLLSIFSSLSFPFLSLLLLSVPFFSPFFSFFSLFFPLSDVSK